MRVVNTRNFYFMKAVIAMNKLGYIGLNGSLPWKSSDDLKHYNDLIKDGTLVVGYNTFIKLPKKYKDKTVIFDNKLDITEYQKYDWCIGGKKTYEKLCPLFDEIHISIINDETIGDTKAPELILNENCKIFYYEFDVD